MAGWRQVEKPSLFLEDSSEKPSLQPLQSEIETAAGAPPAIETTSAPIFPSSSFDNLFSDKSLAADAMNNTLDNLLRHNVEKPKEDDTPSPNTPDGTDIEGSADKTDKNDSSLSNTTSDNNIVKISADKPTIVPDSPSNDSDTPNTTVDAPNVTADTAADASNDQINSTLNETISNEIDENIKRTVTETMNIDPFLGMSLRCRIPSRAQRLNGTLQFLGHIPNLPKGRERIIAGLLLDGEQTLGTDGRFLGNRYFTAPDKKGYFVPFKNCIENTKKK